MRRHARRGVGAVALLSALVVTGCPFTPEQGGGGGGQPKDFWNRTSATGLLHNLQKAYEKRNIAEYESLLATDFVFQLSNEDVVGHPEWPSQWGRDQEILVQSRMFDNESVQKLTLAFDVADSVWDPADDMYTTLISNVSLYLLGSTPGHPEVKEYRVVNGRSKFWFRKNPWTASGKADSIWTIVKWEDNPIGG
jgi:hypothetical protein